MNNNLRLEQSCLWRQSMKTERWKGLEVFRYLFREKNAAKIAVSH